MSAKPQQKVELLYIHSIRRYVARVPSKDYLIDVVRVDDTDGPRFSCRISNLDTGREIHQIPDEIKQAINTECPELTRFLGPVKKQKIIRLK